MKKGILLINIQLFGYLFKVKYWKISMWLDQDLELKYWRLSCLNFKKYFGIKGFQATVLGLQFGFLKTLENQE